MACSSLECDITEYPDIRKVFSKIRELGFRYLDLALFENWQQIRPDVLASDGGATADLIASSIAEAGLKVCSINTRFTAGLNDPGSDSFRRLSGEFKALLDLAGRLGCPNITMQPGYIPEDRTIDESIGILESNLTELIRLAEGSGITLSLEAHQGTIIEKPEKALELIRKVWPSVGLTYDPSHYTMQGYRMEDTEALLDYMVHVHVRNAAFNQMQATMQNGTVDFAALLLALLKRKYDGALSMEYFSGFDRNFENTFELKRRIEAILGDNLQKSR